MRSPQIQITEASMDDKEEVLILFLMTIMSTEDPVSSGSRAIEITRYN